MSMVSLKLSCPRRSLMAPRLRPGCSCETAYRLADSWQAAAGLRPLHGGSCAAAWLSAGSPNPGRGLGEHAAARPLPTAAAAPRCGRRGLWRWQSFCVDCPKIESFFTRETKFATFNAWQTTGGRRWWADCRSGADCRRPAAAGLLHDCGQPAGSHQQTAAGGQGGRAGDRSGGQGGGRYPLAAGSHSRRHPTIPWLSLLEGRSKILVAFYSCKSILGRLESFLKSSSVANQ